MCSNKKQHVWPRPQQLLHWSKCLLMLPKGRHKNRATFHTWSPPNISLCYVQHQITCSTSHSPESLCTPVNTERNAGTAVEQEHIISRSHGLDSAWGKRRQELWIQKHKRRTLWPNNLLWWSSFLSPQMWFVCTFIRLTPAVEANLHTVELDYFLKGRSSNKVTKGLISAFTGDESKAV